MPRHGDGRMRRSILSGWAVLPGVLAWGAVGICWAAGAGHHAEFNLTEEIFRWINFIVLVIVLYVVLAKILPGVLQDHRGRIQQAIDEAKASRETAERLLRENQQKTANLQEELNRLQAQAAQEREELARRMEVEAEQLAARIVSQARIEVERATERARQSLREEAAALTVQIAEEILQREVRDEDNQAIVRRYIARIGELN
jgi:F-type H+-transporting ATPase subunit b